MEKCKTCGGTKEVITGKGKGWQGRDIVGDCPDCKKSMVVEKNMTELVDDLIDKTVDGCKEIVAKILSDFAWDEEVMKVVNRKLNKYKKECKK